MVNKQVNFRIPSKLLENIDKFIDRIKYKSRGQIFCIAVKRWIEEQEYSIYLNDIVEKNNLHGPDHKQE